MNPNINAIFLDVGNTLRVLVKDEVYQSQARERLVELTGVDQDALEFTNKLDARYKNYRKWAFEQLTEAPEADLWTRWLTPELPQEKIRPIATELTYHFRQAMGRRVLQENAVEVVDELYRRGYTLGIISNVITSQELPDWLETDGLKKYFKAVVLSSLFGRRKPHPSIYHEAVRQAGVQAEHSVYVGDNFKRDVTGTREAGFGMVVILVEPEELEKEPPAPENQPDVIIHRFVDLLELYLSPDKPARLPRH